MRAIVESAVISVNRYLTERVKSMSNVTLLRNCHPSLREDYARKMLEEGLISKFESQEFIKPTIF